MQAWLIVAFIAIPLVNLAIIATSGVAFLILLARIGMPSYRQLQLLEQRVEQVEKKLELLSPP